MTSHTDTGGRLVTGLLLVALGGLFLAHNLDVLDARPYLRYWPAGLIAIGVASLVQACGASGRIAGVIWIAVGSWLLLEDFDLVHMSPWDLWPLLLVLVGGSLVWRALFPAWRSSGASGGDSTVGALAVMSGVKRVNSSRDFRGGDLTAIMGGAEIDLRQATIAGDEAVIEVFAMWGGIELRVPETWIVVNNVLPVLGGVEQKTRLTAGERSPRLVVRGLVIMGGVEIKN